MGTVHLDADAHHLDSVGERPSIVFQAHKLGFKPGEFVVCRKNDEPIICKLIAYQGGSVTVAQVESGRATVESVVPVETILQDWLSQRNAVT